MNECIALGENSVDVRGLSACEVWLQNFLKGLSDMDEVIGLLRGRVVLCGQLSKLFNELVDLLKNNSSDNAEVVAKINAIIKDLSLNATKSQTFLDGVKMNSLGDFISSQEEGIKRNVASKLLSQTEKLQAQLKVQMDTAVMLTERGKNFADFTLNLMTQMHTDNTYGAAAETSAHAKRHIFDANV